MNASIDARVCVVLVAIDSPVAPATSRRARTAAHRDAVAGALARAAADEIRVERRDELAEDLRLAELRRATGLRLRHLAVCREPEQHRRAQERVVVVVRRVVDRPAAPRRRPATPGRGWSGSRRCRRPGWRRRASASAAVDGDRVVAPVVDQREVADLLADLRGSSSPATSGLLPAAIADSAAITSLSTDATAPCSTSHRRSAGP